MFDVLELLSQLRAPNFTLRTIKEAIMKNLTSLILAGTLLLHLLPISSFSQNGIFHEYTIEVNGTEREYILYEPEAYNGDDILPLIFVFHGFDYTALLVAENLNLSLVADTAQFFIVYPQGLVVEDLVFGGSGTGWNIPGNYLADHDDILFMNAIIDDIISNPIFDIDINRIHSTGHSNGAEMSYYLACSLSDRIASVAGNAGQIALIMMDSLCTPERLVSVLHSLGTNDPFYPVNGNEFFPPLEGVAEYWAALDGCDNVPEIIELPDIDPYDGSIVFLKIYGNCDPGFEVLCYRIQGGGHSWPGSGYSGANNDIDIGMEMWAFFKRNPHPNYFSIPETRFDSHLKISPNPCSGSANLQFTIYESGFMICDLLEISGVKVKSILNEKKLPGTYEMEIDLRDLKPGIYFCVLKTGEGIKTKKIVKL